MTVAAQQLREYLEVKHPGIRISRKACRNTAGGAISQHSAYGSDDGYDSNALDIMGGSTGGVAWGWDANVALIQQVVDEVRESMDAWSVRLILWQVPDHYGHAHIDFWPTILMRKWCGGPETPAWKYSTGDTVTTREPEPENGRYDGSGMATYKDWANGFFDLITDDEIAELYAAGFIQGDPDEVVPYWVGLRDLGAEGRTIEQRAEVARFVQTSTISAWLASKGE